MAAAFLRPRRGEAAGSSWFAGALGVAVDLRPNPMALANVERFSAVIAHLILCWDCEAGERDGAGRPN